MAEPAQHLAWRTAEAIAASLDLPVGTTPKEEVWALGPTRLYRYRPTRPAAERHGTPVLLVYALINRPYIFDLLPERSFVRHLLDDGFDVFLLDWGVPGRDDARTTFDDYATAYLPRAVRRVLRTSGADRLHLLGYCIGATLATVYALRFPEAPLQTLTLLTPPIDFTHPEDSVLTGWLTHPDFDLDGLVDALGNVPASVIETGSKLQKPVENYVQTYELLVRLLEEERSVRGWQALHRWVHDGVPFAGEAFRQWIGAYVQRNELARGVHEVDGRRLDLGDLRPPLLVVTAQHDHIVPPSQSHPLLTAAGSDDLTHLDVPAGHVGLMAGSAGQKHLWPALSDWLAARTPAR